MIFWPVLAYCSSVRICSVSDTLRRQSSARRHPNLPSAARSASGRVVAWSALVLAPPWFWHGLRCCLCCVVRPGALGLGYPPLGYMGQAGVRWSTPRIEKIQKRRFSAFPLHTHPFFLLKTPPHHCRFQKFRPKTKRPLQRVCVLCYTCLTSLEREESVK